MVNFPEELSAALRVKGGFKLLNLGTLSLPELKSGDFIVWKHHIGVVALTDNDALVYQSNGTDNPKTEADQAKNLGLNRGVHPIKITDAIDKKKKYWGTDYIIYRIVAPGDVYKGGYIFYIDQTLKHGEVCALYDLSNSALWYNGPNTFVSGTSSDLGSGKKNTDLLIQALGTSSAAYLCKSYQGEGYSDWYLPSGNDLYEMLDYLDRNDTGSFANDRYISSTDANTSAFWGGNFNRQSSIYGTVGPQIKSTSIPGGGYSLNHFSLRAVRNF